MPINYKDYPPNWKEIRARILERAKHRCEWCKVPNGEIVERCIIGESQHGYIIGDGRVFGDDAIEYTQSNEVLSFFGGQPVRIVLTIAHLDHDKENHDVTDDRLAALCQKCHLNYDRPRHVAKRKAKIEANKSIGLFRNNKNKW